MDLTNILQSSPQFKETVDFLKKEKTGLGIVGLPATAKSIYLATINRETGKKLFVIAPDTPTANNLSSDLVSLGLKSVVYPARTFDFRSADSHSREYESIRLGVLSNLAQKNCDFFDAVICTAESAMQATIPEDILKKRSVTVTPSSTIDRDTFAGCLLSAGYTKADMIEGKGQFSVRGSIIDFFPPNEAYPIRIELWGDDVDSIKFFDCETQRSIDSVAAGGQQIDEVKITPATEILVDDLSSLAEKIKKLSDSLKGKGVASQKEMLDGDCALLNSNINLNSADKYYSLVYDGCFSTVLDYIDSSFLSFVCESSSVKERAVQSEKLLNEEIKELFLDGQLCRSLDKFSLTANELLQSYEKLNVAYIDNFPRNSYETNVNQVISVRANQMRAWTGSLSNLIDEVSSAKIDKWTTIILSNSEKQSKIIWQELVDRSISCFFGDSDKKRGIIIDIGNLSHGVEFPDEKIKIITTRKVAGDFANQTANRLANEHHLEKRRVRKNKDAFHSLDELKKGDYVVHDKFGIGVFDCITVQEVGKVKKDFIKINYAADDVLYVPVTQLDLISKYIGSGDEEHKTRIKLNRLGSPEWKKTKNKVKAAVREMAGELVSLYAKRMTLPGIQFGEDIDMQADFESRFEFEETDDQLNAISEIKQDMEKPYPMDRLLCGDVGFGKTEVALRAAFKCIADGYQVAMLVPTTILCLQHYRTFLGRFEGFPISVDMLCRFREKKQQTIIKKKLADGTLDMVVGTHGLIAKSVTFKKLGLLIIDEEQRFGVIQKEKLKQLFPNVDVLTLSATPIPRTLNMAMSGIRDMSVLQEPPFDRSPVQTFVMEYDMGVLVEAMMKELRRGGQVYFLHNDVDSIYARARQISELIPDAKIGVGHGQMSEQELSEVWRQLVDGEIDILVCTTIIETGVDVPNVNTLIIENADRMGLSQLHQLRGRVGRSSVRAYAFFTFPMGKALSSVQTSRLNAIRQYTQFGSGFKIAARDLEIRGAGNLLGTSQHGHIATVGYNMYMQLLSRAVEEIKASTDKQNQALLNTDVSAAAQKRSEQYEPNGQRNYESNGQFGKISEGQSADIDTLDEPDARRNYEPNGQFGKIGEGQSADIDTLDEPTEIDIQIDAHIPEYYISSVPQRLEIYRKIADIHTSDDALDVIDEMLDRYGEVPESVNGLVTVSLLRNDAMRHGIYKIGENNGRIILYFRQINPETVMKLTAANKKKIFVSTSIKKYISLEIPENRTVLDFLQDTMRALDKPNA